MRWTVPNILTALRLLAAPLMAVVFLVLPRPYADMVAFALFTSASLTDFLDGYLARAWDQRTRIGTMLDPIADKAMVVIALGVLLSVSSMSPALLLPAALILFREVFVSGLREYLGAVSGTLAVTLVAKWKTTVQMIAIAVLLLHGIAEHYFGMGVWGMDEATLTAVLNADVPDEGGIGMLWTAMQLTGWGGLALLWLAAVLTAISGADYFRKALPHLKEPVQ
ncbi:MAG: CDP-diacylglycerol--glycerol-3-phosphate 3-phosphatidyltransferase [Pseudomonadota bacterium]